MGDRLLTVRQLAEAHPAFTESALRMLLWRRRQNGLARACRKVGRRIVISEQAFFAWLETDPASVSRPWNPPKVERDSAA